MNAKCKKRGYHDWDYNHDFTKKKCKSCGKKKSAGHVLGIKCGFFKKSYIVHGM